MALPYVYGIPLPVTFFPNQIFSPFGDIFTIYQTGFLYNDERFDVEYLLTCNVSRSLHYLRDCVSKCFVCFHFFIIRRWYYRPSLARFSQGSIYVRNVFVFFRRRERQDSERERGTKKKKDPFYVEFGDCNFHLSLRRVTLMCARVYVRIKNCWPAIIKTKRGRKNTSNEKLKTTRGRVAGRKNDV